MLHGKELAQLKEVNSSKTEIITKLENDISTWKENSGQENNEQLSTKLEGKERELEGVIFQLKENKNDLERAKVRYKHLLSINTRYIKFASSFIDVYDQSSSIFSPQFLILI